MEFFDAKEKCLWDRKTTFYVTECGHIEKYIHKGWVFCPYCAKRITPARKYWNEKMRNADMDKIIQEAYMEGYQDARRDLPIQCGGDFSERLLEHLKLDQTQL